MSVLAETAARVAALGDHMGFMVGRPEGPGWSVVSSLVEEGLVDRLAADLVASVGRPDVAGSYLGAHLSGPVISRPVAALALDRRCPDVGAGSVAVHLHADGWFDDVAFLGPTVAVLAADPAAGQAGTVVLADISHLRAWWAALTVATVAPLLEAVRARLPFGRRGLWGSVADSVAGSSLAVARAGGAEAGMSWDDASCLLDALAAVAPVPLVRPEPFTLEWSGGETCLAVRGTCCLYFRTVAEPDPAGEGYCTSCPFVDEVHRRRRWTSWLEQEAAGAKASPGGEGTTGSPT